MGTEEERRAAERTEPERFESGPARGVIAMVQIAPGLVRWSGCSLLDGQFFLKEISWDGKFVCDQFSSFFLFLTSERLHIRAAHMGVLSEIAEKLYGPSLCNLLLFTFCATNLIPSVYLCASMLGS